VSICAKSKISARSIRSSAEIVPRSKAQGRALADSDSERLRQRAEKK
jgi:hypothetical protein